MTRVAHVYGRTTEVCVVSWVIFIDRPADVGDLLGSSKILTHAAWKARLKGPPVPIQPRGGAGGPIRGRSGTFYVETIYKVWRSGDGGQPGDC